MKRTTRSRVVLRPSLGLVVVTWGILQGGAMARSQEQPGTFQLRPGIVGDVTGRRLYVASPDGGVEAVDLVNGNRLWSTKAASKPLGVVGDRLVTQADNPNPAGAMSVVTLNPTNGQATASGTVPLPPGVRALTKATPTSAFVAR